jgi:hypothetical protein
VQAVIFNENFEGFHPVCRYSLPIDNINEYKNMDFLKLLLHNLFGYFANPRGKPPRLLQINPHKWGSFVPNYFWVLMFYFFELSRLQPGWLYAQPCGVTPRRTVRPSVHLTKIHSRLMVDSYSLYKLIWIGGKNYAYISDKTVKHLSHCQPSLHIRNNHRCKFPALVFRPQSARLGPPLS